MVRVTYFEAVSDLLHGFATSGVHVEHAMDASEKKMAGDQGRVCASVSEQLRTLRSKQALWARTR